MTQKSRIKKSRVYSTIIRSWTSFIGAFFVMTTMWLFCLLITLRLAPGAARFFGICFVLGLLLCALLYIFNEPIVKKITGAIRIRSRDQSPKLWDAVHEIIERTNGTAPRIYLVDEKGLNAFAFGWGFPYFSAVGATQGLIDILNEKELRSVMAHEVGHLSNLDMFVSILMTLSVVVITFTGWALMEIAPYTKRTRETSSSKKGDASGLFGMIIAFAVGTCMFYFGRLFGYILQAFVSRQREYAADATSAKTMDTSEYLITALEKIVQNPKIGSAKTGAAIGFLCIEDPDPTDMFSTHPSRINRIAALRSLESRV